MQVLILVVMDDALVQTFKRWLISYTEVLILVVMDDALVPSVNIVDINFINKSLNPCCNG